MKTSFYYEKTAGHECLLELYYEAYQNYMEAVKAAHDEMD